MRQPRSFDQALRYARTLLHEASDEEEQSGDAARILSEIDRVMEERSKRGGVSAEPSALFPEMDPIRAGSSRSCAGRWSGCGWWRRMRVGC